MASKAKKKHESGAKKTNLDDRGTSTFREINIDKLDEPDEDLRFYRSSSFEDLLLDDLRREGAVIPVIVRPKPNSDRFIIVDGVTRARNARLLGKRLVSCQIIDVDESAAIILGLKMNIYRKRQDSVGLGRALKVLHDTHKIKYKDLAKRFDFSRSWVSKLVALNSLPVEYQRAVSRGDISVEDGASIVAGDRHVLEHIDERRKVSCEACSRSFDSAELASWRLCRECQRDLKNIQEERQHRLKADMERADKRAREGQKLLSDE